MKNLILAMALCFSLGLPKVGMAELSPLSTDKLESLSQNELTLVAALLAEMGYFTQQRDSVEIDSVSAALMDFQRNIKVPQTGQLDEQTWKRLSRVRLSLKRKAHTKALNKEESRQTQLELADTLHDQGDDYRKQKRFSEAEQAYQQSLAIKEKLLGVQDKSLIPTLNHLAKLYVIQHDYVRAEPLYLRAIAIGKNLLGGEHPEFVTSFNELALLHLYQNDYAYAQLLFERALQLGEKVFGSEHPAVATILDNLGTLYDNKGELARAEPLYQRIIAIREKVFGKEHLKVAASLYKLAKLYKTQGNYAQAVPLLQRVLAIDEKIYGKEHAEVGFVLNELAGVYYQLGDLVRAEPFYQRALLIREKIYGKEHSKVAPILNNLGGLYRKLGDFARAKSLYQRALVIVEKVYGKEHPIVATVMNNLALVYDNLGDYTHAEPLYQRALVIREKIYGKEHPSVATSLNNLGELYRKLGDYVRAEPLHQRALAIREKIYGKEHPDVAQSINNLALLYSNLGDYARAEPLYQRALAIAEKVYGKEHPLVATSLNNLASFYSDLGDYARAESVHQRALAIREKVYGKEHPLVALSLNNMAVFYEDLGDYARAESLHQRALAIRKKVYETEHPDIAQSLNNLAELYGELGDYARAEPLHQRALAIREKVYGKEHPSVATSWNNLAILYQQLGDYARAKTLYQRALVIYEKVYGKEHPSFANSLNNLAELYRKLGDYVHAELLYQRAFVIREKIYGKEHPSVATSLNNLAVLYDNLGDYTHAEPLHQRALAIREKVYGKEHPSVALSLNNLATLYLYLGNLARAETLLQRALSIAIKSNQPELLRIVQYNLSHLLAKQDNLNAAIFFAQQAVNILQSLRGNVSKMDKKLQKSFLKDRAHVYRHLVELLLEQNRLPEAQQVLAMLKEEEYFSFVRGGARTDVGMTPLDDSAFDAPWAQRYQEISQQLAALGHELGQLRQKAKLGLTYAEESRRQQLRADMTVANQALHAYIEELTTTLAQDDPRRALMLGARNLDKLKPLQGTLRQLGEGVVLVHYLVTENKLHILLTTPDIQLAREALVGEKELNQTVFDFRHKLQRGSKKALRGRVSLRWKPKKDTLDDAKTLYDWIIKPIEADLKQAKATTLMLSLDGTLRYVPIAALFDGKKFIAERYATVIYTEAARSNLKDYPQDEWTLAGLGLSEAVPGFNPLPAVVSELNGIVRQGEEDTEGVLEGVVYLNQQFDAKIMLDVLDEGYPVLHIASHFVFEPGTQYSSYLLLGNGDKLTLAQIREAYDFNSLDLLTLSACNTAMGARANGIEVEGFGVLAQRLGAKGVLATLWKVADTSTGLFMQQMYQLRAAQLVSKAKALQQIQQSFIQGKKYAHPYYWAPFILMGNWL